MQSHKGNLSVALVFFMLFTGIVKSQLLIDQPIKETLSVRSYADLFVTEQQLTLDSLLTGGFEHQFKPLVAFDENFGFSKSNFWVRFEIQNRTDEVLNYFLETGRPITDTVTLYLKNDKGELVVQENGDAIPFAKKSVAHRKSVFHLKLQPNENIKAIIHLKSDGEVVMLPLTLSNQEQLLFSTYKEQLFFGFFYGILVLAAIIYLFFYAAMRDTTFVYYGMYVIFIALLQFSLDGFFHQYLTPNGGWLSDRAVLASALASLFFFSNYGRKFLSVHQYSNVLNLSYIYGARMIFISFIALFLIPDLLAFCYPLANIIGLLVLVQILFSIAFLKKKKVQVDNFFIIGITFLVLGFTVFILNNLHIVPNSFFTENGSKFGIGLEIIFLSLSMGNRIRTLRKENEENQLLALQRANDMSEIKSSFLSNISHELRTPLNLIMGVAHTLGEDKKDLKLQEKCKLIVHSSENLLGQIEDILDFTVIEKGEQELNVIPFNLRSAIEKVVFKNSTKAESKKLLVSCVIQDGLPENIIGDKVKLMQILNNLMDNAVKFTKVGQIVLQVNYTNNKDNTIAISFSISDTGIGISKGKMSTIFESFSKKSFLDKREYYGLGLGLYIVKNFVDLQGGTIAICNNEHEGITCQVNLTFQLGKPEILNSPSTEKPKVLDLKDAKILLVEDNKMNQKVISLFVKKWKNAHLTIANNGKEALDTLQTKSFDIILMDLQMPIMDGFEAIAAIRDGKAGVSIETLPIIVLTADSTDRTRKEVFRLGVNDYLTKPVKGDQLFDTIKKNLVTVSIS